MKRLSKIVAGVACGLALSVTLDAGDMIPTNHEYECIVKHNVFGLRPPPPQTYAPVQSGEPSEIITPNGIISIFGPRQVLFKVSAGSQEKAYVLEEGQLQDGIEVMKIDETAQLITFNNHGTIQNIPLAVVLDSGQSGHIFIGSHLRHEGPLNN